MKKIISVLLIAIMALTTLTGCGQTPSASVEEYLNGLKIQDQEAVKSVTLDGKATEFVLSEDDKDSEEIMMAKDKDGKNLLDRLLEFTYTVGEERVDGDKAEVDVVINTYDYSKIMGEFMGEAFTKMMGLAFSGASEKEQEDAMLEIFADTLTDAPKDKKDYKCTFKLTKKDDIWKLNNIDDNDDALNALMAGMYDSLKDFDMD